VQRNTARCVSSSDTVCAANTRNRDRRTIRSRNRTAGTAAVPTPRLREVTARTAQVPGIPNGYPALTYCGGVNFSHAAVTTCNASRTFSTGGHHTSPSRYLAPTTESIKTRREKAYPRTAKGRSEICAAGASSSEFSGAGSVSCGSFFCDKRFTTRNALCRIVSAVSLRK